MARPKEKLGSVGLPLKQGGEHSIAFDNRAKQEQGKLQVKVAADLRDDLLRLFEQGDHSDLIISNGSKEIEMHRSIMQARARHMWQDDWITPETDSEGKEKSKLFLNGLSAKQMSHFVRQLYVVSDSTLLIEEYLSYFPNHSDGFFHGKMTGTDELCTDGTNKLNKSEDIQNDNELCNNLHLQEQCDRICDGNYNFNKDTTEAGGDNELLCAEYKVDCNKEFECASNEGLITNLVTEDTRINSINKLNPEEQNEIIVVSKCVNGQHSAESGMCGNGVSHDELWDKGDVPCLDCGTTDQVVVESCGPLNTHCKDSQFQGLEQTIVEDAPLETSCLDSVDSEKVVDGDKEASAGTSSDLSDAIKNSYSLSVPYDTCSILGQDLLRMYLQQINCDICLCVDGVRFLSHKCVLASRSSYFNAMLGGQWSESELEEIELQGISAQAMEQLLLYLYGGVIELCTPSDLMELFITVDMYGVDTLKIVLQFYIRKDLCHFFHKPCNTCLTGASSALNLCHSFYLEELEERCLKWTVKYFTKIWSNKAFAGLSEPIHQKCVQSMIASLTENSVLDIIMDCNKLSTSLPRIKWTEAILYLTTQLMDSAIEYTSSNLIKVITAPAFLQWGKVAAWKAGALEEIFNSAIDSLPIDTACSAYRTLVDLRAHQASLEESDQNILDLLETMVKRCEKFLRTHIHQVARSKQWTSVDKALQSEILKNSSYIHLDELPDPKPRAIKRPRPTSSRLRPSPSSSYSQSRPGNSDLLKKNRNAPLMATSRPLKPKSQPSVSDVQASGSKSVGAAQHLSSSILRGQSYLKQKKPKPLSALSSSLSSSSSVSLSALPTKSKTTKATKGDDTPSHPLTAGSKSPKLNSNKVFSSSVPNSSVHTLQRSRSRSSSPASKLPIKTIIRANSDVDVKLFHWEDGSNQQEGQINGVDGIVTSETADVGEKLASKEDKEQFQNQVLCTLSNSFPAQDKSFNDRVCPDEMKESGVQATTNGNNEFEAEVNICDVFGNMTCAEEKNVKSNGNCSHCHRNDNQRDEVCDNVNESNREESQVFLMNSKIPNLTSEDDGLMCSGSNDLEDSPTSVRHNGTGCHVVNQEDTLIISGKDDVNLQLASGFIRKSQDVKITFIVPED